MKLLTTKPPNIELRTLNPERPRGQGVPVRCSMFDVRCSGFLPHGSSTERPRCRAFTLIELLVVISIIAILAGLLIPAGLAVKNRTAMNRAEAELATIANAVESYKIDRGSYPPDHPDVISTTLEDLYSIDETPAWTNSLYYELVGVIGLDQESGRFYVTTLGDRTRTNDVTETLRVEGILNRTLGGGDSVTAKNYLPGLKANRHTGLGGVQILGTVVGAPPLAANPRSFNAFRYVSSKPMHNTESFDLWVDVLVGGKQLRISNWRSDPEVIPFE